MTKRFDGTCAGGKLHMQSLGSLAHFDYRQPASYSYEQAIRVMRRLDLSRADIEQQVLRAFFNVVGRNCDDHVKNIAFLMDRRGEWSLSPAFDVSYALNPAGEWTSRHQMSINGWARPSGVRTCLLLPPPPASRGPRRARRWIGASLPSGVGLSSPKRRVCRVNASSRYDASSCSSCRGGAQGPGR